MSSPFTNALYQTLMQMEKYPQLLLAEKSLLALDNYIHGYLSACSNFDGDTLAWYHAFCQYVVRHFAEPECRTDIRAIILAHGYDDCSGVDCFITLLKQFAQSQSSDADTAPQPTLAPHEVRALRFDLNSVFALAQEEICAHPEKYFGIAPNGADNAICYDFSFDARDGMVCLAYDREKTLVTTSTIQAELKNLPVITTLDSGNEAERYCVLTCE